ncbi:hypothetical protein D3C73_1048920 [compost metagenome]
MLALLLYRGIGAGNRFNTFFYIFERKCFNLIQTEQSFGQLEQFSARAFVANTCQGFMNLHLDFQVAEHQGSTIAAGLRLSRRLEQLVTQLRILSSRFQDCPDPSFEIGISLLVLRRFTQFFQ